MVMEQYVRPRSSRKKQQRLEQTNDSPSINLRSYPDGQARKVSIGITIASSKKAAKSSTSNRDSAVHKKRDTSPLVQLPEEDVIENEKFLDTRSNEPHSNAWDSVLNIEEEGCRRRKWTSLNPFQDKANITCIDSTPKAEIQAAFNRSPASEPSKNKAEDQEIHSNALESTKIFEVYANRKSVIRSEECIQTNLEQAFAARRESTLIRYNHKKNREEDNGTLKEFAFEKTEEIKSCKRQIAGRVRFDVKGEPNPIFVERNNINCNDSDGNKKERALRMKLRNALGSINSSEKFDSLTENGEKEPKSDTIETDSEEPYQIAKPVGASSVRSKRIISRLNAKAKQGYPGQESLVKKSICKNDTERHGSSPSTSPITPANAEKIFSFNQDEFQDVKLWTGKTYSRKSKTMSKNQHSTRRNRPVQHNQLQSPPRRISVNSEHSPTALVETSAHESPVRDSPSYPVTEIAVQSTKIKEAVKTCKSDNESPSSYHKNSYEKIKDGDGLEFPAKEELQLFIETDTKKRSSRVGHYESGNESSRSPRRPQVKRKANKLMSSSRCSKRKTHERADTEPDSKSTEDDNQSDLLGAVKQFAIVLQNFKRKVERETDRKTSQILACLSETIQKELQNIELQIQSDFVKYANVCKTKYRNWEANLQDQNEKLRLIHQNFRNDLAKHLQLCKNTLSQIEGEQIELKSIAERQKTSHRKLLSRADELIETQMADAEVKIASVRKAAGSNLHALKNVLGDFFGQGN